MKRKELTQKERFKMQKLLETVLEEDGELFNYKPGWSDVRVAEECGFSVNIVKSTRARTFGVLFKRADNSTNLVALQEQVSQLQTEMAQVKNFISRVGLTEELEELAQPQKSNGEMFNALES